MHLPSAHRVKVSAGFLAVVLFCSLAACTNYCVNVQTNPGGTINTGTTCGNTTMTGNVILAFGTSSPSDAASSSTLARSRATQIFVTLHGVDALPMSTPGADAPSWQPLAPQLVGRPVQLDLNAHVGDFCQANLLGAATVSAGVYTNLRLRVITNPDSAPSIDLVSSAPTLDDSACGASLFDCLIAPDSAPRPLEFFDLESLGLGGRPIEPGVTTLSIPPNRIDGGLFRVLPGTTTHLVISLDPRATVAVPTATSIRFTPSFSVSNASCTAPE